MDHKSLPVRTAVAKIGTGLAGAFFEEGRLALGLFEWGKVVQNVGAEPEAEDDPNKRFPKKSSANWFLSNGTAPRIIHNSFESIPLMERPELDLDSQEISLLLETEGFEWTNKKAHNYIVDLWQECGLRGFSQ